MPQNLLPAMQLLFSLSRTTKVCISPPNDGDLDLDEGLIRILTPDELYGVLAHEFAHVRNRDILISTVVAVMAGA